MSKKKVIILSVVLILAIAYISRVAYVNIVQAPIKVERYSMGDTVKHCNYQFRVTDYRIYYRNEFEKKYGVLDYYQDRYKSDEYAFIVVKVYYKMLSDKYDKKYEFSPTSFHIQDKAIDFESDVGLYYDYMPDDCKTVEKVGDSSNDLLIYAIPKSNITEEHWKNIKNLDFKLSLNDAENKKIEISLKK